MAFSIYKSGQGYWTRVLTASGAGLVLAFGAGWLWNQLSQLQSDNAIYIQASVAAGLLIIGGVVLFILLNKPKVADFMIATEGEMKKVNWPARKELIGSTIVVIGGTLLMSVLLFLVDLLFTFMFREAGVLRG